MVINYLKSFRSYLSMMSLLDTKLYRQIHTCWIVHEIITIILSIFSSLLDFLNGITNTWLWAHTILHFYILILPWKQVSSVILVWKQVNLVIGLEVNLKWKLHTKPTNCNCQSRAKISFLQTSPVPPSSPWVDPPPPDEKLSILHLSTPQLLLHFFFWWIKFFIILLLLRLFYISCFMAAILDLYEK